MPRRSPPSARPGTTSKRSSGSPPSQDAGPQDAGLRALENKLGFRFRDRELLRRALTHSSFVHEHFNDLLEDNERLEFLGDAVIELVAADFLYRRDPLAGEGALTLGRAALVSTGALAEAARGLGLGDHLRVGRGTELSGGRELESLLANALEAVLGAIYLDQGLGAAKRVFHGLASGPPHSAPNYKGRLQELTQAEGTGVPEYQVVEALGPGHRRNYRVEVTVGGVAVGEGAGSTRRAAEQAAAREAIDTLQARE